MQDETFYLDGVDARTAGIHLQRPIEFSGAVPIVKKQSIPGRNGDLIWETGSYENRSGIATCFCLQKDVEKALSAASRFLMCKGGYRRLETSDDPDHFWMVRVKNGPRIRTRANVIASFEIEFDCKPQRFLKSGEHSIVLEESGAKLYNPYGQIALPLIKVESVASGLLSIDGKAFLFDFDGTLYLDSETQNAYNEDGNQNMAIKTYDFPVLPPGEFIIRWSSWIPKVEITPRWWEV